MKNEKELFYQTPLDSSEKEFKQCFKFLSKMKTMVDKSTFTQYMNIMISYHSGSLSFAEVQSLIDSFLSESDVLRQEFHQLLSDLSSTKEKKKKKKPECNKIIIRLPKPKSGSKTKPKHSLMPRDYIRVSPSYYIIPEAKRRPCDHEHINGIYVAMGDFKEEDNILSKEDMRLNDIEDILLADDRYFNLLSSTVKFGVCNNEQCEKPPLGFKEFVEKYDKDIYEKKLESFNTDPKLALQEILPELQSLEKRLREAKRRRVNRLYASRRSRTSLYHQQILSFNYDFCCCRLNKLS